MTRLLTKEIARDSRSLANEGLRGLEMQSGLEERLEMEDLGRELRD